jgi:hypothetical protein
MLLVALSSIDDTAERGPSYVAESLRRAERVFVGEMFRTAAKPFLFHFF